MTRIVVQVVELNRRRHVELESITAALAEAVAAGERDGAEATTTTEALEPVRELVRALRGLLSQPLPEALMAGTGEVAVELEAPVHELEHLADELERILLGADHEAAGVGFTGELEQLVDRLRLRAAR